MSKKLTITNEDILEQIRLTCKLPEITEAIISRKIIEETAIEAGIKVETEELQKAADQIRVLYKLHSADDTWVWLQKHGLSVEDFEKIAYTTIISGKLTEHLFANKVESWFFEHQLDYAGVAMYEVVLDNEDLALELFYAIKEGEMSFYDVAHKYILDVELRRKGGYLGVLRRQNLKPEISAAVFAAKPPQVLKPILTSIGVHLVFVEEIVQPQLDNILRQKIALDLFQQWLKQQISQVEIEKIQ